MTGSPHLTPARHRRVAPLLAVLLGLALSATTGAAQAVLGSEPDKSPFLDIKDGQRVGAIGGFIVTGPDLLGLRPKSALAFGARYDVHMGGPAYLIVSALGAPTTRNVLDPTKKAGSRDAGTQSTTLLLTDVSVAVSAIGERSWHGLQPLVHLGFGTASGLGDKADVGGYSLGTKFTFVGGLALRFITGKNSELRCDASWHYLGYKYPDAYHTKLSADSTSILPTTTKLSSGTLNNAITVSWTWGIFR
jgi:hypothetical protein